MNVNISAMWVSIALWSLIYRSIFRVNLLKIIMKVQNQVFSSDASSGKIQGNR